MLRRLALATTLIAALAGLSACGGDEQTKSADSEGVYVTTGHLKYQVEISRILNPGDVEDREYFYGLTAAEKRLAPNTNWFAIFMRVENESKSKSYISASRFRIEDTTGKEFEPLSVPVTKNVHAYVPSTLGPESTFPAPNATAGNGSAGGSILLFKIPVPSFANRPLELHVNSPTGVGEAEVELDV